MEISNKKWKYLSIGLIGLMATIGVGGLFTDQLTPRAIAMKVVTAGDVICSGCINSSDIAANAIQYPNVDKNFIAVEHRDDCDCGGTGWDPNGVYYFADIADDRITNLSVVMVNLESGNSGCVTEVSTGHAEVTCLTPIPQGTGVNYAIFNHQ